MAGGDERAGVRMPGGAGTREKDVHAALVCLVASLSFVSAWVLNVTAYPSFNDFFPEARDIATAFSGVWGPVLVALSMRAPRVIVRRDVLAGCVAVLLLATLGMFWAASAHSAVAATVLSCLRSTASAFTGAYLGLALVGMGPRRCVVVLVVAYLLKYLWMGALWFVPYVGRCVAFLAPSVVVPLAMRALAAPGVRRVEGMTAPFELSATNPQSTLPVASRLFLVVLLFQAAFGFAITYGSRDSYPQPTILAFVAFAAVAAFVLLRRREGVLDALYAMAFGLVLAGLLLVLGSVGVAPAGASAGLLVGSLSNTLLEAGSEVIGVTSWLVVAAAGGRSFGALLPATYAISATNSLGLELGAASGHLQNYLSVAAPEAAALFAAVIAFVFALYNFMAARRLSLDATVAALRPAEPVTAVEECDARVPAIERRVEELACACGLTARETEVLGLLARGRNAAYIQESLTISRNTVKSYVARVYGKLGVHSHQEVIDLVEAGGGA